MSAVLELAKSLNREVSHYRKVATAQTVAHETAETPYQKQLRANHMVLRAKLSENEKLYGFVE